MGLTLASERAISWIRVEASPFSFSLASSSRWTMVSMLPRAPAGAVASGLPFNWITPVNGSEPGQKKSAGMGSALKLLYDRPVEVSQRSAPRVSRSPARTGEATRTASRTTPNASHRAPLDVLFIHPPLGKARRPSVAGMERLPLEGAWRACRRSERSKAAGVAVRRRFRVGLASKLNGAERLRYSESGRFAIL